MLKEGFERNVGGDLSRGIVEGPELAEIGTWKDYEMGIGGGIVRIHE
jgi:hypothetical protein